MDSTELRARLEQADKSRDFYSESESIVRELRSSGAGIEAVRVILQFMEEHPTTEYGQPGPLVHFVEKLYQHGYEAELLASLSRRPVAHTVWMLNRIMNDIEDPAELESYRDAMRAAGQHPRADEETRQNVELFLEDDSE